MERVHTVTARRWLILSAVISGVLGACCNQPVGPLPTVVTPVVVAAEPFPRAEDFQGTYKPGPASVTDGMQSTYNGTVVVTMVDRDVAAKVLPPGTRLADPVGTSTRHPVIHLIGDQLDPRFVYWNVPGMVLGDGYREMILLVPFVVIGAGTNWHNYAVRMYLSNILPVWGGNWGYGYAKEEAKIVKTVTGNRMNDTISQPDLAGTTTWFLSDVQTTGAWVDAVDTALPPRWADIRKFLQMPVLGVMEDLGGGFTCSYWNWQLSSAKLAPATSKHEVVTKFRAGMEDWPDLGPLYNALDGAVSLSNVQWRLAFPSPFATCEP